MGKGQDPVTEADLHGFVDEEIGPERRAKVAEHLEQKPLDAALIDTWRGQNEALRGAFARIARESIPLSLSVSQPLTARAAAVPINARRLHLARAARQQRVAIASAIAFLAGSIAVATGAVIVQHVPSLFRSDVGASNTIGRRIATRAAAMYRTFANDRTRPVEIGAVQKPELGRWLSERTGLSLIPDFSAEGLKLIGGRITPGELGAAGFLLYEMATGERIGVFMERSPGDSSTESLRATPGDRNTSLYGREKGTYWAIIGSLGDERWKQVALHLINQIRGATP
jgi:anti-sigma factor RsiW